jgi:hypothetical protein
MKSVCECACRNESRLWVRVLNEECLWVSLLNCRVFVSRSFDMDMPYTRVLHPKVAHTHSHSQWQMTSRVLRHTAAAMRAHKLLQGTVGRLRLTRCSFPRVRFALLYIFTGSKKICNRNAQHCTVWHVYVLCVRHPWSDASTVRQNVYSIFLNEGCLWEGVLK